ncbi:MAG TPA: TonB family protein [Haliangiales bacterium]|nr:TonB family protein [Haliangiales bacterium]
MRKVAFVAAMVLALGGAGVLIVGVVRWGQADTRRRGGARSVADVEAPALRGLPVVESKPISTTPTEPARPRDEARRPIATTTTTTATRRRDPEPAPPRAEPAPDPARPVERTVANATTAPPPAPVEIREAAPPAPPPIDPPRPEPPSGPIDLPEAATPPRPDAGNRPPDFPEAARQRALEGDVVLKLVIDRSGAVSHLEVLRGQEPFAAAAREAVARWRYAPAMLDGRPIAVFKIVKIPFRLSGIR